MMLAGNLDLSKRTCKVVSLSEKIKVLYERKIHVKLAMIYGTYFLEKEHIYINFIIVHCHTSFDYCQFVPAPNL